MEWQQTFVKSLKGGEGFRKFCITRDNQEHPFSIDAVHDMLRVNPFKGIASNKTSVYIFRKSVRMRYPMDNYFEYAINPGAKVEYSMPYESVRSKISSIQLSAKPINEDVRSPWLTVPAAVSHHVDKFLGPSPYKGRKGIEPCGAKGVYLVEVLERRNDLLKISNLIKRSRLQEAKDLGIHVGFVDAEHVYPMVGGRNIEKWGINSYIYMLVPHSSKGEALYRGIPTETLQAKYYRTYDWLYYFHDLLRDTRIRSAKFFDVNQFPWYRLDNVGDYTFKPYKVLWQEQAKSLDCCVVSTIRDEFVFDKIVVTDSKVLFVPFDSEDEAHYLCGVLNSKIVEQIIQGYTIDTNRGTDIVKNIRIPRFDPTNPVHMEISKLSLSCHKAYKDNDRKLLSLLNKSLNEIVPVIFP